MKCQLSLVVLIDNTAGTDRDLGGEAGLSFFIETGGKKILFDTGLSGLFLSHAEKLGISLRDLDFLVFSHGHNDHTGGLATLARHFSETAPDGRKMHVPEIITHPRSFWLKEKEGKKNGSAVSEKEVRKIFPVNLSEKPVWITDDLVFLGEIPRRFAFEGGDLENRTIQHPDGKIEPDYLLDDTALAFRSDTGLVIITGCSHAGICNITEYAREVCGEAHVRDIIGGLHLIRPGPKRLQKTGKYLNRLHLDSLHACHCTSLPAKTALADYCSLGEVRVGTNLVW
ncbi:MAG: MBL fold metallo-hydrolase [Methanomicrobiales archaeon HGW-Methanomicrobiales-3]|jgi:7,8-dihydropterin-6-yl-methyl-4-(beta-D-ribofuranosyl)aminobenzene 5'-phosphate synthase|nr:MAG: MBL fold metallo-hydrolase [Methanomicrobiales archaeon HGW-Methanomicrobiales-3]